MRILFISGSVGLGHVTRDLAIAAELRRQEPTADIVWLAASPASEVLDRAGETLLPEAQYYANDSAAIEHAAAGSGVNLIRYLMRARGAWARNVEIFKQVLRKQHFDAVVADEAYEVGLAVRKSPGLFPRPFVMIYDFVGLDSATGSPIEKLGVWLWNWKWSRGYGRPTPPNRLRLFIGEPEDVPDTHFGFLLPNRRAFVLAAYQFIGYVLPFDPAAYADHEAVRRRLGYGDEPLVVCSIGGTAIGKELLELCGRALPIARRKIARLRMILVCGPRLSPESLNVPHDVEVRGHVGALYEHFAASDLAVVQGGGTTTLELTALRRPFLYFPLEGHCEQEIQVAGRLARHQAGVKMILSHTTPESLAKAIAAHLGTEPSYSPIPVHGAERAAELICQMLRPL